MNIQGAGVGGRFRKNPAPQGNIYRRPDTRVEYQLFSDDYFSNADVNLFFGNIWVDEVTSINFSVSEQILPIYGYNSFTFDAVARGKRLVQGSFAINFKTTGYLQTILQNASAVQYAVNQAQKQGAINPSDMKKYKLDEILQKYGKSSFEQIAEEYEAALWGTREDTNALLSYNNRAMFQHDDPIGFDIKINYGAVSEAMTPVQQAYFATTNMNMKPNLTVETLNGVQIFAMSKGAGISADGQPITEQYQFLARDFNAPLYHLSK